MALSPETIVTITQIGADIAKGVAETARATSDEEARRAFRATLLASVESLESQPARAQFPTLRED